MEEVFFFEFLEHGAFDFDELVRHEEGEEGVGIRVHGHIERDDLVEESRGMDDVVYESEEKHPERPHYFAAAVSVAVECFAGEEAFEDVLA